MRKTFRPSLFSLGPPLGAKHLMGVASFTLLLFVVIYASLGDLELTDVFLFLLLILVLLLPFFWLRRIVAFLTMPITAEWSKFELLVLPGDDGEKKIVDLRKVRTIEIRKCRVPNPRPLLSVLPSPFWVFIFTFNNSLQDDYVLTDWGEREVRRLLSFLESRFPRIRFVWDFTTWYRPYVKT